MEGVKILMSLDIPEKNGEPACQIMVCERDTAYNRYVAWHYMNGNFFWGHYCSNKDSAIECAIKKVSNEICCSLEYAKVYWNMFHKEVK